MAQEKELVQIVRCLNIKHLHIFYVTEQADGYSIDLIEEHCLGRCPMGWRIVCNEDGNIKFCHVSCITKNKNLIT